MAEPLTIEHRVKVRYAETDQMGLVHHSAYPVYLEEARTELMERAGYPYHTLERMGYFAPLRELSVKFLHPLRYGEALLVRVWVDPVSRATLRYNYEAAHETSGVRVLEGYTLHVITDANLKPRRVPDELRSALEGGG